MTWIPLLRPRPAARDRSAQLELIYYVDDLDDGDVFADGDDVIADPQLVRTFLKRGDAQDDVRCSDALVRSSARSRVCCARYSERAADAARSIGFITSWIVRGGKGHRTDNDRAGGGIRYR